MCHPNLKRSNDKTRNIFAIIARQNKFMNRNQKNVLLRQIIWDYNIPAAEIDSVLKGNTEIAGHYNQSMLVRKIVESYPWFTVLELITPEELCKVLDNELIEKLRSPSLRKKYEFIQKRLPEIIRPSR